MVHLLICEIQLHLVWRSPHIAQFKEQLVFTHRITTSSKPKQSNDLERNIRVQSLASCLEVVSSTGSFCNISIFKIQLLLATVYWFNCLLMDSVVLQHFNKLTQATRQTDLKLSSSWGNFTHKLLSATLNYKNASKIFVK